MKLSLFVQSQKKFVQHFGVWHMKVVSQSWDLLRLAQHVVIINGVRIKSALKLTTPHLRLMVDGEIGRIGVNVLGHVTREYNPRSGSVTIQIQPMEVNTVLEKEPALKFVIQTHVQKKNRGKV